MCPYLASFKNSILEFAHPCLGIGAFRWNVVLSTRVSVLGVQEQHPRPWFVAETKKGRELRTVASDAVYDRICPFVSLANGIADPVVGRHQLRV